MDIAEITSMIQSSWSQDLPEREHELARWHLRRLFPHAAALGAFSNFHGPDAESFARYLVQFEAEHAHEPLPPPISREMLINNIEYIQYMRNTLGSACLEVVIPLSLDFPAADLETMLDTTHKDATPKAIADEMLRRQAAADAADHAPGEAARPGKHGSA